MRSLARSCVYGYATLAVAVASGCVDDRQSSSSQIVGTSPSAVLALAPPTQRTYDDVLADINVDAPGFGGIFLDDEEEPVIVLRAGADAQRARAAVIRAMTRLPGRAGAPLHVVPGQFEFAELRSWLASYVSSGISDGVTMLDVNERRNRIVIGVDRVSRAAELRRTLNSLGVPAEAVDITQLDAARPTSTLRDSIRPIIGGTQYDAYTTSGLFGPCSIGFNARLTGDLTNLYAVSASHCTHTSGVVESDSLYQPARLVFWRTSAAHETVDPGWSSSLSGCPGGKVCRYSDAAAFRYENPASGSLGRIARTLNYTTWSNQTTLVRDTADFILNGEITNSAMLVSGMWANKVGRSTGWTVG